MTRLILALAFFAVTSAAFAAPVPKSLQWKPLTLTAPRPLLIRMAVVENDELKLACSKVSLGPHVVGFQDPSDPYGPKIAPLRDVVATDRNSKALDSDSLKKRLKTPTEVVVVPYSLPKELWEWSVPDQKDPGPPTVDTSNEWRRVLATDAIIIDGDAFDLDWEQFRPELQIVPAVVDANEKGVVISAIGRLRGRGRREVFENHLPRSKDQKAATAFDNKVRVWGVVVLHEGVELPKEHRRLFSDDPPFAHGDGTTDLRSRIIHGPF